MIVTITLGSLALLFIIAGYYAELRWLRSFGRDGIAWRRVDRVTSTIGSILLVLALSAATASIFWDWLP